jgi:hypothetical protein
MMEPDLRSVPGRECDVVMKGGITSGVLYPSALVAIGGKYRLRGIGGASAGAIGAALGAAAEFGRASGGYERLGVLPDEVSNGKLAALFQPQPETRRLLRLMLAATGNEGLSTSSSSRSGVGRAKRIATSLVRAFPVAALLGGLIGLFIVAAGVVSDGWQRPVLIVAGSLILIVGVMVVLAARLLRLLTNAVPHNMFGICRGTATGDPLTDPGFTDWLADSIDRVAGRSTTLAPLTFGQLWAGADGHGGPDEKSNDLRMIHDLSE